MFINYTVTTPELTPKQAIKGDVGYDLRSATDMEIRPWDTALVPTGLAIELPSQFFAMVCSKSGLALKHCVTVVNAPGVIDSGYRGEIKVILKNSSGTLYKVDKFSKIAQLVILQYPPVNLVPVLKLDSTVREDRGFGSTGL
jgi:dUTP pyrophosphatase